jgi:hypothetical protein
MTGRVRLLAGLFMRGYRSPPGGQLHCVSHSMIDLHTGHRTIKAGMPPASSVISIRFGINFSAPKATLQLMHICLLTTGGKVIIFLIFFLSLSTYYYILILLFVNQDIFARTNPEHTIIGSAEENV